MRCCAVAVMVSVVCLVVPRVSGQSGSIDFEDAWADQVLSGDSLEFYYFLRSVDFIMLFEPDTGRYPGLVGGFSAGNIGGFGVEGPVGPTTLGIDGDGQAIRMAFGGPSRFTAYVGVGPQAEFARVIVEGYLNGTLVSSRLVEVPTNILNTGGSFTRIALVGVDQVRFIDEAGGSSRFVVDGVTWEPSGAVEALGVVASPDVPVVLSDTAPSADLEMAVYDATGTLVATSGAFGGTDGAALELELGAGDYFAAVTYEGGFFGNLFDFVEADGEGGVNTAPVIAGKRLENVFLERSGEPVVWYSFTVSADGQTRWGGGPGVGIDAGVVGEEGVPFQVDTSFGADVVAIAEARFVIYDALTGDPVFGGTNGPHMVSLDAGVYDLAVGGRSSAFLWGYTVNGSDLSGSVGAVIAGQSFSPLRVERGEVRFVRFEIAEGGEAADLDGNGLVDVFDLIAFLQAFGAALN